MDDADWAPSIGATAMVSRASEVLQRCMIVTRR
jgi:hypothetical protein